jgi:hypothetical protein
VLVDPQGSDDVPVFWPKLDLCIIDGLDHVTPEYDPDLLKLAASMIGAGKPLDTEMALAVAGALRELAEQADITPQPVRALNIAIHYLAAKELHDGHRELSTASADRILRAWQMGQND